MKFDPDIHHRRSIRLKNYDYSSNGMYFVTICTQDRTMLFGEVVGADLVSALPAKTSAQPANVPIQMQLNDAGKMVKSLFLQTSASFSNAILDKFIIMPNHVHFILGISDTLRDRADTRSAPTVTLDSFVRIFKSKTTVEYIRGVESGLYEPFNRKIWQRNYFERIIRDKAEYQHIHQYIDENPARWNEDEYFG